MRVFSLCLLIAISDFTGISRTNASPPSPPWLNPSPTSLLAFPIMSHHHLNQHLSNHFNSTATTIPQSLAIRPAPNEHIISFLSLAESLQVNSGIPPATYFESGKVTVEGTKAVVKFQVEFDDRVPPVVVVSGEC
jgi:hypothetical protein